MLVVFGGGYNATTPAPIELDGYIPIWYDTLVGLYVYRQKNITGNYLSISLFSTLSTPNSATWPPTGPRLISSSSSWTTTTRVARSTTRSPPTPVSLSMHLVSTQPYSPFPSSLNVWSYTQTSGQLTTYTISFTPATTVAAGDETVLELIYDNRQLP